MVIAISGTQGSAGRQPGTPTIGTATAGNGQATVTFTAPSYLGKPTATTYRVIAYNTSNVATGQSATGSSSPITVTGLSNGTTYRFRVRLEGVANSLESSNSNDLTPVAPPNFAVTPNFPNFVAPNFPNFVAPPNFPPPPNFPNFVAPPNFPPPPNFPACTPGAQCNDFCDTINQVYYIYQYNASCQCVLAYTTFC